MSGGEHASQAPAAWLVKNRARLPRSGRALDVACGRGRNALWLARQGFETTAIDRDAAIVAALEAGARRDGLLLTALAMDLEGGDVSLGDEAYDVIVVVHYLHRPLFPALRAALRPGGVLVYETFTVAQAARGRPTNPAFLLEPGELPRLVAPLEIRAAREGDYDGRMVSSVVGVRQA
jgi:2-polyprenyl-3-methyl-5-hydroxy-6-metoxy-1,4-benzoquinol methylase